MGKICMWCVSHRPYGFGRYKCDKTGEFRNCLDPACFGYESSLLGSTPAEADRTVEVVIPVPVTEEYRDYGLHMFFYPSKCGVFDREELSAIAEHMEISAEEMENGGSLVSPDGLRWYAKRIREVIGKAGADEQQQGMR